MVGRALSRQMEKEEPDGQQADQCLLHSGGKLAFYAGILDPLPLGGNEVAVVTGHEMGHEMGQEMAHAPRVQDPYEAARRGG